MKTINPDDCLPNDTSGFLHVAMEPLKATQERLGKLDREIGQVFGMQVETEVLGGQASQ